jgi:hypothetical protein
MIHCERMQHKGGGFITLRFRVSCDMCGRSGARALRTIQMAKAKSWIYSLDWFWRASQEHGAKRGWKRFERDGFRPDLCPGESIADWLEFTQAERSIGGNESISQL